MTSFSVGEQTKVKAMLAAEKKVSVLDALVVPFCSITILVGANDYEAGRALCSGVR